MCGIFAIIGNEPVVETIYHGLIQLQHRGQDAAGIFTYSPKTGEHCNQKNIGLVTQVFSVDNLPIPDANWAIGHVRYSTVGRGNVEDSQPHCLTKDNTIAIAYNGNIVNYVPLKKELERKNIVFESSCDAEAILHLFSQNLQQPNCFESICSAVAKVYEHSSGAYSVVGIITGVGLFAFRDPFGIRPLLYGKKTDGTMHAFASETSALSQIDLHEIYDIKPGEVVFIDKELRVHQRQLSKQCHAHCSFEFNYFAKPNTIIENREVYRIRSHLGRALAKKIQVSEIKADVVVPVPDTARPSAIALAHALKIPLEEGFVKQEHIGRTFIMPVQGKRKKAVSQKLAAVDSVFKGKQVIIVDDSIVRGTVSKKVVSMARKAGAKKVYFASTYPPIRHPCLYGIDFPMQEQLIAWNKSVEEICEEIGADELVFNDVEGLQESIGFEDLCTACLTGNYSTDTNGVQELQQLRLDDILQMELALEV